MKKLLLLISLISFGSYAQFSESFEAATTVPAGWTVLSGGDANTWVGTDLGTSTGLQAQNGTKMFSITYGAAAHDDYLVTPQFTVTAGVTDKLSFWARSRDPLYPEEIAVMVSTTTATAAAFTATLVPSVAPVSGGTFQKFTIDLTSRVGQTIYVGFHSTTTDMFVFDIDNVVLGGTPSCTEPLTPPTTFELGTTGSVSWTAASPAPANGYDIYYSTSGVAPTAATTPTATVGAGVTTYNMVGLTPFTKYYLYVRSKCGATNSVWGHLTVFNTINDAIPLPYATGFDTDAQLEGWTIGGNNTASMGLGTTGANAQSPTQYWIFNTTPAPAAANNNFFFSRPISLTAGEQVTLSFWYRTAIARNFRVTIGTDNSVAAQTTVIYNNAALPIATAYAQITAPVYTVPTTGIYFFGFNDLNAPLAANTLRLDTVNITSLLSVKDFDNTTFSVYPNPSNGFVNVSNNRNALINAIEMTDLNGRIVKSVKVSDLAEAEVNISDLSSGVYMMNIKTDQGSAVKKIVKQ